MGAMTKIRGHPRRCLLGALVGAIAATALVIAASFVLRPPPLAFSVADARSGATDENKAAFLNLTLVAGNPSGRAAVEYEALDVMLWYGTTDYIETNTSLLLVGLAAADEAALLLQPPRNATAVEVTARTLDDRFVQEIVAGEGRRTGPFNVAVAAQVRFKVAGVVYTRPYNVRVSCSDVYFVVADNKSAAAAASSTPIDCHG
ncbi:Os06g0119200 [Oryza sativa Japonica Group]|jgi:hypothetical protein|uniref:Uncharacterized protein n=3 Tax=Oryza sativa TaxID=4530 RepID=Q5VQA5_ORYSJ|nr:hypothetical protein OsI_21402 [Oryza sativa Indica Group]KAB8100955.1 hypothetical protein EE612_031605 [Oryza sativa]KAF2924892.1 hypothetical protein DAI22_06g012100 [Oryza sativa Japonica Group]BAD68370.1 hypothetical protein [Oryza sativa Japonica Group]BAD68564.1 hypothetical protein [Oryza sativa Japonica Group]